MSGPVVTDIDRKWALDQCPPWATLGGGHDVLDEPAGEIVDETDFERAERLKRERAKTVVFRWDWFVQDQIEAFERYFSGETSRDWSKLWRTVWWPKADPWKRAPKLMARVAPAVSCPVFRRGQLGFDRALEVATPSERKLWDALGVAQFKPGDPRLKKLQGAA